MIVLIADAPAAGTALHTLIVDDLDAFLDAIGGRGVEAGSVEPSARPCGRASSPTPTGTGPKSPPRSRRARRWPPAIGGVCATSTPRRPGAGRIGRSPLWRSSRPATWLSRQRIRGAVVWPIDRVLLRVTGGGSAPVCCCRRRCSSRAGRAQGCAAPQRGHLLPRRRARDDRRLEGGPPGQPVVVPQRARQPGRDARGYPVPRERRRGRVGARAPVGARRPRLPGVRRPTASGRGVPGARSRSVQLERI